MGARIYKFGRKIKVKNLYLASKNKGKIEEYKKLLAGVNCKLLLQPESLEVEEDGLTFSCLLYTSPSPRDPKTSRMPSSA